MKLNKVNIVGMGALGVMYGEFLSNKLGKDNVEFIVNKSRIEKYNTEKLYSNGSLCDFNLVDEDEKGSPADLLIFAVKATGLESAIKTARNKVGENTIIISLLNGITSEEIIGSEFGQDKVLYTICEGNDPVKIGNKLSYTNMGYLWIGIKNNDEGMNEKLNAVIELFNRTGFPYKLEKDVMHRLWSKFMLNVGVNQVVMIYEGTYDTIHKEGEAREMMISAMREVIALANEENINVTEDDLNFYVSLVGTLNPNNMPSMRQDGLAKRKSEVELFSGTVTKLGKKHNIPTPVNDEIYRRVKEIENHY